MPYSTKSDRSLAASVSPNTSRTKAWRISSRAPMMRYRAKADGRNQVQMMPRPTRRAA
jgi:hypothetical protein